MTADQLVAHLLSGPVTVALVGQPKHCRWAAQRLVDMAGAHGRLVPLQHRAAFSSGARLIWATDRDHHDLRGLPRDMVVLDAIRFT